MITSCVIVSGALHVKQRTRMTLDPTFVPGVVVSFDVCSCRVFKETDRLFLSDSNNRRECQQVEFEYEGVVKQDVQKYILNYRRSTGYCPFFRGDEIIVSKGKKKED